MCMMSALGSIYECFDTMMAESCELRALDEPRDPSLYSFVFHPAQLQLFLQSGQFGRSELATPLALNYEKLPYW
jgi:hypothetical protein